MDLKIGIEGSKKFVIASLDAFSHCIWSVVMLC